MPDFPENGRPLIIFLAGAACGALCALAIWFILWGVWVSG